MVADKIKRLAYITSMATGGLAGFNYKELLELESLGTDVEVYVTKHRPGPYMPRAEKVAATAEAVPVLAAQFGGFLRGPVRFCKLLLESLQTRTLVDFAVAQLWAARMLQSGRQWIHCHWGDHKLYIGYYCHRLTGLPLSVTLHGYDLYRNPNWAMLERALRACAQIITISEHNRRLLLKRYGALGERVRVIRLFADVDRDPDQVRNETKILIVGGFQPRKGYDVLLHALKSLGRRDLRLWVVGYPGPVDVAKLVAELDLRDQVTIFGQVSDDVLRVLYTYCDIFCMPSRMDESGVGEGLPVALMEAMSFEKPVVATVHTGIPELVPDILVPENDSAALAEGIATLADDRAKRQAMGVRNRQIVASQYSRANVAALLDSLRL